jgi:hypothetical protein
MLSYQTVIEELSGKTRRPHDGFFLCGLARALPGLLPPRQCLGVEQDRSIDRTHVGWRVCAVQQLPQCRQGDAELLGSLRPVNPSAHLKSSSPIVLLCLLCFTTYNNKHRPMYISSTNTMLLLSLRLCLGIVVLEIAITISATAIRPLAPESSLTYESDQRTTADG